MTLFQTSYLLGNISPSLPRPIIMLSMRTYFIGRSKKHRTNEDMSSYVSMTKKIILHYELLIV